MQRTCCILAVPTQMVRQPLSLYRYEAVQNKTRKSYYMKGFYFYESQKQTTFIQFIFNGTHSCNSVFFRCKRCLCTNFCQIPSHKPSIRFPEQLIPIMMRSLPFANRPKHPMCKQFTFILIKHKAMGILSALTFHWIQSQILMTTRRRQFIRCIPPVI